MSKASLVLLLLSFFGCNSPRNDTAVRELDADSVILIETDSVTNEDGNVTVDSAYIESDCVFNNDYKGLTSSWMTELGIKKYAWINRIKAAKLQYQSDTLFLRMGGCTHFGQTIEAKITDSRPVVDSVFWSNKALSIATKFKMTKFKLALEEKRTRLRVDNADHAWLIMEDDNLDDNLFYDGVEIDCSHKPCSLIIGFYFN